MANRFFRPIADWVVRYRADIVQFGWPLVLFETFNWTYDHFFFGIALLWWGPVWGGVIPVLGAFTINAIVFWLYDHLKVDWLKAKLLDEIADKESKTRFETVLTWHRKEHLTLKDKLKGISLFIGLTSFVDPVILAIYYRENYFRGVSARDWFILFAATCSACFLWLLGWEVGIGLARTAYHFIHVTFFP